MRRGSLVLAAAGLAVFCGASHAARLAGMGEHILSDTYFNFSRANLDAPPVSAIKVGDLKVILERTRLTTLQARFGGGIAQQGGAGSLVHWLCYTSPTPAGATRTWFISNALGGGDFVMMVALEALSSARPVPDCPAPKAGFEAPQLGVPALGAPLAALRTRFGTAHVGIHNTVSYRNDRPADDGLGTAATAQYLGYTVSADVVTGVGVGETSIR